MSDIQQITEAVLKFRDERDWKQFHNPKDLAMAMSIECNELLELFLWKTPEEVGKDNVKEELADVLTFAFLIASHYDLNMKQIILDKLSINDKKYPIEKSKGNAKKYNEL